MLGHVISSAFLWTSKWKFSLVSAALEKHFPAGDQMKILYFSVKVLQTSLPRRRSEAKVETPRFKVDAPHSTPL